MVGYNLWLIHFIIAHWIAITLFHNFIWAWLYCNWLILKDNNVGLSNLIITQPPLSYLPGPWANNITSQHNI